MAFLLLHNYTDFIYALCDNDRLKSKNTEKQL